MKTKKQKIAHGQIQEMKRSIVKILQGIGEDPAREGLVNTPKRAAKAFEFLTSGYSAKTEELIGDAIFAGASDDIVLIRDIEFYSLCEHHILPFFGKAHVAYVPNGKIIGLSKIPRLINAMARRLQVQERLTREIAAELDLILRPQGICVILEASHLCMMMRGVEKQGSMTVTRAALGSFSTDAELKGELQATLQRRRD